MRKVGTGGTAEDREFAKTLNQLIGDGTKLGKSVLKIHEQAEMGNRPTEAQCMEFAVQTQEFMEKLAKYYDLIEGTLVDIAGRVGD